MTADELRAMYADLCRMTLKIRRYSGPSNARTWKDYTVKGYYRLFSGKEIIGTVVQGDQQVIVLADSLAAAGFKLPITTADMVVTDRARRILDPIGERKALDDVGTLVALDLQARG